MRYRFYTSSERAWNAMLTAIQSAQKSVYWECYILLDDTLTHRFYDLLEQKARQGVTVKIIVDSIGSWQLYHQCKQRIEEAGGELLYYNHVVPWWNKRRFRRWWFLRNHRKVLIVDETIGFIGGVNVGEAYRQWFDLHLRVEGTIVALLLRSFTRSYGACGGREDIVPRRPLLKLRWPKAKVFYLDHTPLGQRNRLKRYYLRQLLRAQRSVTIVTPYFIPHRWMLDAMRCASARGVRVEVVIPERADYWLIQKANEVFSEHAATFGVSIYRTRDFHHAKALLVDDAEAMVGSNNIDAMSFDYNLEGNVVFRRKDMVLRLTHIIEQMKREARVQPIVSSRPSLSHRCWRPIILLLQPLL